MQRPVLMSWPHPSLGIRFRHSGSVRHELQLHCRSDDGVNDGVSQIVGGPPATPRDLVASSLYQVGSLHFYHPAIQEVVLSTAARTGGYGRWEKRSYGFARRVREVATELMLR